jgi:exopolysaccharide biosynthesis polyprenyl glycosylphosphotransferase
VLTWSIGLVGSQTYDPHQSLRWFNEAFRVLMGAAIGTGIMAGILYLSYRELPRLQFIYFMVLASGTMIAYRFALRAYYRLAGRKRPGWRNQILVLGTGSHGRRVARTLLDHSRWGYRPIGFISEAEDSVGLMKEGLPILGTLSQLDGVVRDRRIDEIWVALSASAKDRLEEIIKLVESSPVRIKVVPDYFSLALVHTKVEVLGNLPVIGLRDPLIEGIPRLIKRAFDLTLSIILLPLILPVLGVLGLAIRLDSSGPAFFSQSRVGENGRLFEMYKLRTMRAWDSSSEAQPGDQGEASLHKVRRDPRVTRVGSFLRRYSLDELPQLINVLKGDMSLVGPRPELPWLVDRYQSWQRKRFAVPQGITGWWQINGRSDRPMHLHTEDDLYYVYNYSILLDLWILMRTPFAVIRGKGAF